MPNAPQPPDNLHTAQGQDAQNASPDESNQQVPPPPGSPAQGGVTSDVDKLYGNQFNAHEIHIEVSSGDFFAGTAMGPNNPVAGRNILAQAIDGAYSDLLRGIFPRNLAATQPPPRPSEMPSTEEAQEAWFCDNLTPYERCYVRAAAILHGAPAYLVTSAAKQLYDAFHPPLPQSIGGQGISVADRSEPAPGRELAANTFTEVRDKEDARRLYWQDADSNGSSAFGLMALQLIAREIEGTGGVQGQNSAPIIQQWAASEEIERSWRAAHALGVIWWTLDQSRVSSIAHKWASAKLTVSHYSAAGLIFGAYETESDRGAKTTTELKTLKLLTQLADEARQPGSQVEPRGTAHVVTTAYELIALVSIDTALDGLDRLLGLAYQGEKAAAFPMTFAVFIYGALSYQSLACQGQVRQVLARLAGHAERLTRLRFATYQPSKELIERCEQNLEIISFIFFFLVSSSFPQHEESRYAHYGEQDTLEAEPEIPGALSRDVLLASVFAQDEQATRDALVTLLCAALVNGNARQAMGTLEQWANHLFPATPTNEQHQRLWVHYRRFVMLVGSQSGNWDGEFTLTGFRAGQTWFRNLLNHWPQKKPSGQLAREVLGRLGLSIS